MATGNIKGIVVEIGGNTGPLDKALQGVNKTSKDLQSELTAVNKLLKFSPNDTVLLAQKQKLLAESITNTGNKLDMVKEAERQAQEQFKKGKISEEQYRALQREVVKTEQSLKNNNKQIKEQTTNFDALSNKINSKVNGALKGLAVGIAGAAVGLGALIMKSVESADAIQKAADVYGMTAERVQELTYVGKKLDVELDTITKAQSLLTKNMFLAEKGTGAQAEAFKALKISVVDSNGKLRDGKTVLDETITALGKMPNETERDALAMKLLGKSAMELNPLIKAGGVEIANLTEEAHKSGAVMSNETVAGLDGFGDSVEALKLSLQGAIGNALTPLIPKLQEIADKLKNIDTKPLTDGLKWVMDNGQTIVTVVLSVIGVLVAYKIAVIAVAVAQGVLKIATVAVTAAQWLFNVAMTANPIGLIIAALAALGLAIYEVVKHWKEICQWISNAWDWLTKWNGAPAKDKFSTVTTTYATKGDFNKLWNSGYAPPGYASGTSFATPGLHWVGENGPELLKFRGGESVLNAKDSAKVGSGLTLNIENFVNNRAQDVENLMTESAFYFKQKNLGLGGA